MENLIELKNVNMKYGDAHILKDINFAIPDAPGKGEFLSILGPSGCGKSTILKMIAGLSFPTSGEVLVQSKPVKKPGEVSMVFQAYSSFPWLNVLDNVTFGLKLKGIKKSKREELGMQMLKHVGLDRSAKLYPSSLSGGMKQRVAIARSLITNPKFLLMDEPFGALDIKTRLEMQLLLRKIWKDLECTVIMVTHDISEAVFLADDIFILNAHPAEITHRVKVPFGERTSELKSTKKFNDTVFNVTAEFEKNII